MILMATIGSTAPWRAKYSAQVLPAYVFLGDEVKSLVVADFVNLHNVRLHQPGRRLGFLVKSIDERSVLGKRWLQDFQSDVSPQRRLLGQVDFRHAATPQTANQQVTTDGLARQIFGF